MYNITVTANSFDELKARVMNLVKALSPEAVPEKTLKDFPLQDIMEHVEKHQPKSEPKMLSELLEEDEAKKAKKTKKTKENKENKEAETPETHVSEPEAEVAEPSEVAEDNSVDNSSASEDPKGDAIAMLMKHYTNPEGKKIANQLLKEFSIRNFHLIPDEKVSEFYARTMSLFKEAGLN